MTARALSCQIAALVLIMACAARPAAAVQTTAYVLTSDFSSGSLSSVNLATRGVTRDLATVYSDARVRWFGGLLYVVNRFGQDNIQVIDPAAGFATLRQFSVGNGSNPQDIALVSQGKAYVTRLASSRLLIVDPSTGDSLGAISLAAFADADGLPEMDRMMRVGTRLFVALERLANFQPTGSSVVVAIDTQTDTVIDADPITPGVQAIALPGTNPASTFDYDPVSGRLLIGCRGSYGVNDGGIAWIDPLTLTSGGWAITESTLGGDVLDIVWGSATRSFAIISDTGSNTALVAWNPTTGALLSTLFAPGGFSLYDIALNDRGQLYVCNNDIVAPGIFVLSAATGNLIAGPLDTGLPPVEVTFDRPGTVAAVIPAAAVDPGITFSAPWPQPCAGLVRTRLSLARGGHVTLDVLDLAGRRVRALASADWPAGVHEIAWDVRDQATRPVAAGVYMVRARCGETSISQRVVVAF